MRTTRVRAALLAASLAVVVLMAGGAVAMKVGAVDGAYRDVLTFSEVLHLVLENYVDPVEQDKLMAGAYDGLVANLDTRGAFLTPGDVAAWKAARPEPLADPGIVVLKSGPVAQIVLVTAGSPAESAGLAEGDQIRRIDGVAVRRLSHDQIVRRLQGAPGSVVGLNLVIPREGFRREDKSVARAVPTGPSWSLHRDKAVAVLALRDPARAVAADIREELQKARVAGAETLLVDVRNAATGSPRAVAPIVGLFATGIAATLEDKRARTIETVEAAGDGGAWPGPIAVLVNGGTAGAAESIATVLRVRRQATVYGETTYGLGTEPKLVDLPDGSGLLLSAWVWKGPDGSRWDDDGLKPDQEVRAERRPDATGAEAEADQLRRVLEKILERPSGAAAAKAA